MLCESCKFWEREREDVSWGTCHRRAPRPSLSEPGRGTLELDTRWPRTQDKDFCGEWSARVEVEE